jgi:predicted nucleic acid-binding protein
MLHMLDTNICSYILKHHPTEVRDRFHEVGNDALALSAVVPAELYFGAARHPLREDIRREIDDFTARISIIPWDGRAADQESRGNPGDEQYETLCQGAGPVDNQLASMKQIKAPQS